MDLESDAGFNRLWHIYNEARKSNCFIYDKNKNEWYTPDEFREKYDVPGHRHSFISGLLENLVIRNPVARINAGQAHIIRRIENFKTEIEKDLITLSEFSKKTINYYQDKLKKQNG